MPSEDSMHEINRNTAPVIYMPSMAVATIISPSINAPNRSQQFQFSRPALIEQFFFFFFRHLQTFSSDHFIFRADKRINCNFTCALLSRRNYYILQNTEKTVSYPHMVVLRGASNRLLETRLCVETIARTHFMRHTQQSYVAAIRRLHSQFSQNSSTERKKKYIIAIETVNRYNFLKLPADTHTHWRGGPYETPRRLTATSFSRLHFEQNRILDKWVVGTFVVSKAAQQRDL